MKYLIGRSQYMSYRGNFKTSSNSGIKMTPMMASLILNGSIGSKYSMYGMLSCQQICSSNPHEITNPICQNCP